MAFVQFKLIQCCQSIISQKKKEKIGKNVTRLPVRHRGDPFRIKYLIESTKVMLSCSVPDG